MSETSSGKILFFIESGGPGGAERVVLSLAEEYQRLGFPVIVATIRRGWFTDQLAVRRIKHTLLDSSGDSFDFVLIKSLRDLIRRENVRVVHSHLLDSNFYAAAACFFARCRHIATEHGDTHHTKRKRFAKLKMFLADRLGSEFTAVSRYTAGHLYRHSVRRKKISIVGNPLALPRFDYSPQRTATRKRLGILTERNEHWLWIHVANFRKVKDQGTLLRGFAKSLRQARVQQTLAIVGDGPEKEPLYTLAHELGIQQHVRWLGFSDEVGVYLSAADGFVLTSRSEALPMVVLEAALYELVLLSTNVGGVSEVIRKDETGYLVPPENPDELANAMKRILGEQAEALRLGKAARNLVVSNFLMERVVDKFFGLYTKRQRGRKPFEILDSPPDVVDGGAAPGNSNE